MKTRPATTLLALAALAVMGGCGKTAVRKDAAPVADTVQTAAVAASVISGTFTDSRDGQIYRTVVIGTQTWMAENLNFVTDSSVCYDNDESYCQKYGRLYDWDDAMTACPAGWRMPSDEDWDSLALAVGGQRVENGDGYYWEIAAIKLKSTTGWDTSDRYYIDEGGNINWVSGNGTDDFGFSALPGGSDGSNGHYSSDGEGGFWWSATEYDATTARYREMRYNNNSQNDLYLGWGGKAGRFSLRCVEDVAGLR